MKHKYARTSSPIHELLAKRWSSRSYDQEKIVTDECVISLLEAARWAPSCYGDQPWYFLIFNRNNNLKAWEKALSCLGDSNQVWAKRAPLLILSTYKKMFSKYEQENRWAAYDTGASVENMVLQATAMGLMTRQIGWFDEEKTRQHFSIPEDYQPITFIAVGHPGAPDLLDEPHEKAEHEERARNPLAEHFFVDQWGEEIDLET